MPKAFTEEERARIRERLITAGKKILNKAGLRLLVVDDVAKEAGISKGSFYSFFPSREDFILTIFESWEDTYRTKLLSEITEGKGSPRERLERFFKESFGMLDREPALAHMNSADVQRLMEALPPERLAAHQANDSKVLENAFTEWAGKKLIDAEALACLPGLVTALFSIALHKEDFPEGTYGSTVNLISESLAMRLTQKPKGGKI
jgi:AcrR family transcriptional regulator